MLFLRRLSLRWLLQGSVLAAILLFFYFYTYDGAPPRATKVPDITASDSLVSGFPIYSTEYCCDDSGN
jgi:hypothetical protein